MSKFLSAMVLVAAMAAPALLPQAANAQYRPYYPAYAYPGNGIYNGYYPTPYAGNSYAPRANYSGPVYYGGTRYYAAPRVYRSYRVWR